MALTLGSTGLVIDTPGVRSFGLAHVDPDDVLSAFEDLVEGSVDCEPGCTHESPAGVRPGCLCGAGRCREHGPARLASLRGLLSSLMPAQRRARRRRGSAPERQVRITQSLLPYFGPEGGESPAVGPKYLKLVQVST